MTSSHDQTTAPIVSDRESQPLFLKETMRITDAERLHESALALMANSGDVTVDCEETDGVDASILQILVALKNSLQQEGRALRFTDVSNSLASTWRLAGFDSNLKQRP